MSAAARMLISWAMVLPLACCLVCVSSVHYGGFLVVAAVHLWIFEPAEILLAGMIGRAWNFGKGESDGDEH